MLYYIKRNLKALLPKVMKIYFKKLDDYKNIE